MHGCHCLTCNDVRLWDTVPLQQTGTFVKVRNEAKKVSVPTFEIWTEADEQALVKLEETVELEGAIALEDADCGRLARQRQHECMASAADMSTKQLAALEQMIAATKGRVSIG
jgi:hypothetical protein